MFIILCSTGEVMVGSVRLNETLSDPKVGSSTSVEDTPFVLAHGTSPFGYYDTVSTVPWSEA